MSEVQCPRCGEPATSPSGELFACGSWNLPNQRPSRACVTIARLRARLAAVEPVVREAYRLAEFWRGSGRHDHIEWLELTRAVDALDALNDTTGGD